ncbi:dihydrofolate reductase [Geodermatophilus tzadiensis]|uniref:Dihydrofolate reductase n=1 Tax=Geodermatophilus tzadiensis TaxID=1137988 RepID=A0A2T0TP81_9ACTN|nr:dihydrofolate reductase family protein [Geodermatophilus tzadiensis]PRY47534.1 dihydrofolate reductase [Geodermatophilus tzadiensis]
MAHLIAGTTMSLDGYVADPHGDSGVLYADLGTPAGSAYLAASQAETGAVLMGRRTYDGAPDPDSYADDYEYQVPIVVLTSRPPATPPRRNDRLWVTFCGDLHEAVGTARELAGEKAVTVVGGADLNRQLLAAGLFDELQVDVVPVLLGGGLRAFPGVAPGRLEATGVEQVGERTCLRFRPLP